MTNYHVIGAEISPYSQRVVKLLEYKGIDFTFEHPPGGFESNEFGVITPIRKLPVLIFDDVKLPESQIICDYLESMHPEPSLTPSDPLAAAKSRLICRIVDLYIMNQMLPLFNNMSRKTRKQDVVDHCLANVQLGIKGLGHWVEPEKYAAGGVLSMTEFAAPTVLFYLKKYMPFFGIEDPFADYPDLASYYEKCQDIPIVKKAVTEVKEGLESRFG